MNVRRDRHRRCPLCGFLLFTDGERRYCPRMIPGERRRCGYELRGGLHDDDPTVALPLPTIPERVAMLGRKWTAETTAIVTGRPTP